MKTAEKTKLTVGATINAPVEKVWKLMNEPQHMVKWNFASDDWHSPHAENDLRVGGKLLARMEAKDGSFGFDFGAVYDKVEEFKQIAYTLGDGRKVEITFETDNNTTKITEVFEAERENSPEMQQQGWQAIMNNFKKYVEANILETLHFETVINATPEKVYSTMLDKKHYSEWTSVFNPTSHFKGSWEKGSEIRFLGTEKDGKSGGMISKVEENIPNQFVSLRHEGIIVNGTEITEGPEVDAWVGAHENYTFEQQNGKTILKVDLDSIQQFKSYFAEIYPKALEKLKTICEEI